MKKVNIGIIILLSLLSIYLLSRLFSNDEFSRNDNILLILLIVTGAINSIVVYYRRRRNQ